MLEIDGSLSSLIIPTEPCACANLAQLHSTLCFNRRRGAAQWFSTSVASQCSDAALELLVALTKTLHLLLISGDLDILCEIIYSSEFIANQVIAFAVQQQQQGGWAA